MFLGIPFRYRRVSLSWCVKQCINELVLYMHTVIPVFAQKIWLEKIATWVMLFCCPVLWIHTTVLATNSFTLDHRYFHHMSFLAFVHFVIVVYISYKIRFGVAMGQLYGKEGISSFSLF